MLNMSIHQLKNTPLYNKNKEDHFRCSINCFCFVLKVLMTAFIGFYDIGVKYKWIKHFIYRKIQFSFHI